jgi:hypothetical protein
MVEKALDVSLDPIERRSVLEIEIETPSQLAYESTVSGPFITPSSQLSHRNWILVTSEDYHIRQMPKVSNQQNGLTSSRLSTATETIAPS